MCSISLGGGNVSLALFLTGAKVVNLIFIVFQKNK